MSRLWFQLACGWPEPSVVLPERFSFPEVALLLRANRQSEELPPSEGGATWSVIRFEVLP